MVDITKCANYWKCPLAKCCKRVLAEDDRYGWQSYADYYIENRTECDYFIPVKNEENNINKSEEVKNV